MQGIERMLRELTDRVAIRDILLRYARGVDRRDLALVAGCFTADAAYHGALAQGTIAMALAQLPERMARYERTMHFMGNQLIELAGDTATSETYAVAYHVLKPDAAKLRTLAVRYLDDLVRQGDDWRICRRVVQVEWERTEEIR